MIFKDLNPVLHYSSLLRLALPSILLQSGAPLAITFQTALLGRKSTEIVAAWAIVATATNAATVVFNFLVVGVTAKVTKVVAVGAWTQVGARIRLALGMALVMGVVAVGLLLAVQQPLWLLLADTPKVLPLAKSYFYLRVVGVPPQLLVMCTSGILQGYKRVNLVACLQGCRVLLDVLASYMALYVLNWGLNGVGLGTILASTLVATVAFVCILLLPPAEGRHKIHVVSPLLNTLFGSAGGKKRAGLWSPCGEGGVGGGSGVRDEEEEDLHVALLDGQGEQGSGLPSQLHDPQQQQQQGGGAGGGEELTEEEERVNEVLNESTWKFIWDGLSTMLRSALVQASFFLVLACATSLGMHAVAAHQVLMQLWMINIYIADGFATAGTIVASSIAGHLAKSRTPAEHAIHLRDLREACWRVLYMGGAAGVVIAAVYLGRREELMGLFTFDEGTKRELRGAWLYLALIQPLNSIVFVYDGLIYAAQAFSYMAACLSIGFVGLFLPFIALAYFYFKTLVAAWGAKGVLNAVRFVVAGYKIHFDFLCPVPKFSPSNQTLPTQPQLPLPLLTQLHQAAFLLLLLPFPPLPSLVRHHRPPLVRL
ncbi:hypothetical protein CLOP_g11314 [Closterium sp. NIES-67]|nr:hypothetical protein CLOP_g11314 [Closterium sp. NIES-67]